MNRRRIGIAFPAVAAALLSLTACGSSSAADAEEWRPGNVASNVKGYDQVTLAFGHDMSGGDYSGALRDPSSMLAVECAGTGDDLVVKVTGPDGATMRVKKGEMTARMSFDGVDEQDVALRGPNGYDAFRDKNPKDRDAIEWGARGFTTAHDLYGVKAPEEWARPNPKDPSRTQSGLIDFDFTATCA
ncbi:hypothetical protein Br6_05031 [Rhodococcus sp. Br-6]|nr:hypothetical protein Br6_05031 [Rhodococcus sp. Br-6]